MRPTTLESKPHLQGGAAAWLVHQRDKAIVVAYAGYEQDEIEPYEPRVVHVDGRNGSWA